jgi:NTP pyrophosphatase (non-canonical NTP hydrolase)
MLAISALSGMPNWENAMNDAASTIGNLKNLVRQFVEERAWQPFHSPKNLAMGIAVEAAELMECFLWLDLPASYEVARDQAKRAAIADEMADVFCYLLNMSNVLGIDLSEALAQKMVKNAQKYPADAYRGKFEVQ